MIIDSTPICSTIYFKLIDNYFAIVIVIVTIIVFMQYA